jgi:hypothetical protein
MFMNMYNLEILDEEAFMKWKEEVNDLHPGKGQALFQVSGAPSSVIVNELFRGQLTHQ